MSRFFTQRLKYKAKKDKYCIVVIPCNTHNKDIKFASCLTKLQKTNIVCIRIVSQLQCNIYYLANALYPCVDLQPPSWSPAGKSLVIHWCCSIWFSMRPLIFRPRKPLKIWACLFDFFSLKETEILGDLLASVRLWNTTLSSLNITFNSDVKQSLNTNSIH